jgi:uncharacterized YccA/Bax inhibitor family protein
MGERPEIDLRWISVGYAIFSVLFIGIAVILFSMTDWRGFGQLIQDIKALSDIAIMIVLGFSVSFMLSIGTWNLLRLTKQIQHLVIAVSVGVATLMVINILPSWLAWMRGYVPEDVGILQMLSSSGLPIGYSYLAIMLVITYMTSNKRLQVDAAPPRD